MSSHAKRSKAGDGGGAVVKGQGSVHHKPGGSHAGKQHDHHAEHHHGPYHLRDYDVDPAHHTRSHDAGEGTGELPPRSSGAKRSAGARRGGGGKGKNTKKSQVADNSASEDDTMNQESGEGIAAEAVHAGSKRTASGAAAKKGKSGPSGKAGGRGKASALESQDAPATGQATGEAAAVDSTDAAAIAPEPEIIPPGGTGEHSGGVSGADLAPGEGAGEGGLSLTQATGASNTPPIHHLDKPFTQLQSAGQALPESGELTGATGGVGSSGLEDGGYSDLQEQAAAQAVSAAVADAAAGSGMLSTATGAINVPEATGTAGLLRRVLYIIRGNPNPTAQTLGDLLPGVAARYSVPPANVSFAMPGTLEPLPPDTPLSSLTTEFVARITEASGSTREWCVGLHRSCLHTAESYRFLLCRVFWFDRGGQEAGITPAAYACSMTPEEVLSGALPSVLDTPPTVASAITTSTADPATTASTMPPDLSVPSGDLAEGGDVGGSVLEGLPVPATTAAAMGAPDS